MLWNLKKLQGQSINEPKVGFHIRFRENTVKDFILYSREYKMKLQISRFRFYYIVEPAYAQVKIMPEKMKEFLKSSKKEMFLFLRCAEKFLIIEVLKIF